MKIDGSQESQKADLSGLEFKRLSAECSRGAFHCGESEIDQWFINEALNDHNSMKFRVVTASLSCITYPVGFYALTDHIELESKLPNSTFINYFFRRAGYFSTVRLGWLAVHIDMQRRGFGTIIMGRVIQDFYEVVVRTGISALTLTAINEKVAQFYEGLGFVRYGDLHSPRPDMLLPCQSAIALIENNA